ncbi:Atu4866 domain-containing protein [Cellulosimicrobium sp. Marseille-Q8652]
MAAHRDTPAPARSPRRRRPVVLTHASVRTLDDVHDDLEDVDVVLDGPVVTRVGPGLRAATADAVVVDCTGRTLVPAAAGSGAGAVGALVPGSTATFGVIRTPRRAPLERLVWYTEQAESIWVEGVARAPHRPSVLPAPDSAPEGLVDRRYVGSWVDERADVVQVLTADGRYDETRGGRPHAYQGRFWTVGDHVVYRDDLGFWAYGRLHEGTLHHAHFAFRRR